MSGRSDAVTGLLLAAVGIGILVLWRSGALAQLVGVARPYAGRDASVTGDITHTGAPDSATTIPSVGVGVPVVLSPQAPGGPGTTGSVDTGIYSTWISAPTWGSQAFDVGALTGPDPLPAAIVSGGGGSEAMISHV